ncbi:MAG: OmpA family protein [Bacteroidales bacterium]
MHVEKSAPNSSAATGFVQSVGGLYLAAVALLLLVMGVLALQGFALRTRVDTPAPAAAPQPDALSQAERDTLYQKLAEMGAELSAEAAERNRLAKRLEELLTARAELGLQAEKAQAEAAPADMRASLLNAIEETERQLAAVSQALEVAEQRIQASQVQVAGLGTRLNRALLAKVEELQRNRSDFFARLRDVLGNRPGFKIEGDRFTLPSEVLFAPGSDALLPQGLDEVRRLAATLNSVRSEFPADISWVLRVGGHTDKRPIANARFPSNWELSSMRAVTVVKALIAAGVPPQHVAAAGFGEFQPIATEDDPASLARNRRIEFRLDQP